MLTIQGTIISCNTYGYKFFHRAGEFRCGGAGGVISNIPGFMPNTQAVPVVGPGSPNKLTMTVGGGASRQSNTSPGINGNAGTNSTITGPGPWSITANGGGYGGAINNAGGPGGSGGGGGHLNRRGA